MTGKESLIAALRAELDDGSAHWERLLEKDVLTALIDAAETAWGDARRITVWVCDECGYWRKEQSTGRHQTTTPDDPRGKMAVHSLRRAEFVEVAE